MTNSEADKSSELVEIARHQTARTIRFAETDASGFAHFACYVRLMEETEYSFLRSRGLNVVLYDDRGTLGFPRLSVNIDVRSPAIFEQNVTVKLAMRQVDGKRIVYDFVVRDTHDSAIEIATGTFKVACCRFPDDAPPYAILTPEFVIEKLTKEVEPSHE